MKKISKRVLDWRRRAMQLRVYRQIRNSGYERNRRLLSSRSHQFSTAKLRLPSTISLGGSDVRGSLILFFRRLKDAVRDPNISNVVIDFSKVTQLHPCGTLLFLAEIERLLESSEASKKLSALYPTDRVVEEMFQHVGLLARLGLEPRIEEICAQNVVAWLYASGHEGDLDSIAEMLPKVLTEGSNTELRVALLSGMAEAVANSSEHAYLKVMKTPLPGIKPQKWWLFARQVDDDIAVVICDLGRGIPGTLEANWKEELASYFKTRSGLKRLDHKMIRLAFTVGKTSTDKKNRGKGLKDILKVVQEQKVGSLYIYSNKGVYGLDNTNGSSASHDEKNSINGTIVQWKIPIEAFGLEVSERL
ncbi:hypothetical protein ACFPU0_18225 [Pseudomonas sp. GCM10022186]|uniref:hypothetical protein n=1 Tax=Pseudomonas sp. GCM10022186 TaxID=3252650 RepID=UPI003620E8AD